MSFTNPTGTHGSRQPRGRIVEFFGHRMAGRLIVGAGFVFLLLAFAGLPGRLTAPLLCLTLVVAVGAPIGYSWLLWRRKTLAG